MIEDNQCQRGHFPLDRNELSVGGRGDPFIYFLSFFYISFYITVGGRGSFYITDCHFQHICCSIER